MPRDRDVEIINESENSYSTIAFGRENRALIAKKETPLSTFIACNKVKFERKRVCIVSRVCVVSVDTNGYENDRSFSRRTENNRE